MKQLWQIAGFLRGLQAELRFGDFSRAPLKLLRFQLQEETVECDWVARSADDGTRRFRATCANKKLLSRHCRMP